MSQPANDRYFDGGVTYDLVKHSNGKFEVGGATPLFVLCIRSGQVGGYIANPELSSASEIHWSLPTGETATWTYEGENDVS